MPKAEAERVLDAPAWCTFNRSPETDPVLWVAQDGSAATAKLNGVLIRLDAGGNAQDGAAVFSAPGSTISVRPLGDDEADWRQGAELVFELEQGLTVGYRGFYGCAAD